jgi:hypothetical protein
VRWTRGYVEIRGEAGVGKSAVLKHLATGLAHESQVIVLNPNRTTPNGWSALRGALHFDGTAHDLLADLASDGGAVLFIDSLDNFTEAEQKTAIDLDREVAQIPGFAVVATARHGFAIDEPNWLPAEALDRLGRTPPVVIGELSESEIAELRDAVPALARLLAADHPARDVIRNLYRLSGLSGVPATEPVPRTEIDMAQQWWQSADGRQQGRSRAGGRAAQNGSQVGLAHAPTRVTKSVSGLQESRQARFLSSDGLQWI